MTPVGARHVAILPWGDVLEDYLDTAAITLDEFCNELTGGWLFGYVEALADAGISSVLVCISRSIERMTQRVHHPTGATIWLVPPTLLFRSLRGNAPRTARRGRQARYLSTPMFRLCRLLRKEHVDTILCQEYESPRFDAAVLIARFTRTRLFATFQGSNRARSRVERSIRRLTIGRANGLVVGADREIQRVRRQYRRLPSIGCIPNPADAADWEPVARAEARAALDLPAGASIVCWHGRVSIHQKGLDTLVHAWRAVVADEPNSLLLLLGDGHDADELERLLETVPATSVRWVREFSLDRDRIRTVLSAADAYVFPSRSEGFPVAPIEAMACGLPVVATAAEGVVDVVGDAGTIVPVDDAASLAAAVLKLLRDLDTAELRERARRRVTRFSRAAVGRQLASFFAEH